MTDHYDVDYEHLLDCINPSLTNHDEWIRVGMALKYEGCPFELFDSWSARDTREGQYRGTEYTLRVWNSFQGVGTNLVTGATLTELARSQGVEPFFTSKNDDLKSLGWDDEILLEDEEEMRTYSSPPLSFRPTQKEPFQIIEYLEACFKPDDYINVIPNAFEEDGKYKPYGVGLVTIKVSEYIKDLRSAADRPDFFPEVFGSYDHQAGVWIRVNPVNGMLREGQKGIRDKDIVRFDNALVECDTLPLEKQLQKIKELNLPYKALVYSGGKSIHAIVRVDARNLADYQYRIQWLYEYCHRNGFPVDDQTKNPSRLTRLPGCDRGDQKQFLIETATPISFDDFKAQVLIEQEAEKIEFTDPLANYENPSPLAPELIEGIVRCGHKLLLSGPSKAGKSFALLGLAIAVAEGKEWFGHKCKRGKVLYLNLEIDPASFENRINKVYEALGWKPQEDSYLRVWDLRGKAIPLDVLTPRLEVKLEKEPFDLVIIDPIYKVITGDENNASDMGKFCNLFDQIAASCNCTVAYCHHHSKGSQAHKAAIDRASGSGVFARDPDAIIDMTEIGISEGEQKELKARLMESIDDAYLKASGQWDNLAKVHPQDLKDRIAKQIAVDYVLKHIPDKREAYEES
ncbi:MAG: AAA family ATPase, partial [Allobaculum sp.]|nr:AAA family ATPase [Allobaculum sp.]